MLESMVLELLLTPDRRTVERELDSIVRKEVFFRRDTVLGQRNISSDIYAICGSLGLVYNVNFKWQSCSVTSII